MMRKASLLIILFLAVSASAWGCCTNLSEPSTPGLAIGPDLGTSADHGSGLSPNPVTATHLDIYNNTGTTLSNLYLIIGLPSTGSSTAPATAGGQGVQQCTLGGASNQFRSGDTNPFNTCITNAYLGGTSNTFAKWQTADASLGLTSSGYFTLYAYNLTPILPLGGLTSPAQLSHINFSTPVPVGTIEAAYGWGSNSAYCYATNFTNDGQVTPEPASFMMVGGAALALLGRRLWKRKS